MATVPQQSDIKLEVNEISHQDLDEVSRGRLRVISDEDEIKLKQFLETLEKEGDHIVPSKGGKKKKRNLGKTRKRKRKKKRRKTKKYKR